MTNVNGKMAALAVKADMYEEEIKLVPEDIKLVPHEEPIVADEPIIDGNAISAAFRIAETIQIESHRFLLFRRWYVIRDNIKNITAKNVYNFIGYMITTSNSQTVLGDFKSSVNYDCLKHLVFCFLMYAKQIGYENTFQYRKLRKEYKIILKASTNSIFGNASRKIINDTNMFIENLYLEMNKSLR